MITKNPKHFDDEPPMRLATPREACAYGKFSHTKLYSLINDGHVVGFKRGQRTLIDLDSIDKMHAAMPRIEPRPKPPPAAQKSESHKTPA